MKARKAGLKKSGTGLMSVTSFMKTGGLNRRFMKNVPEEEEEESMATSKQHLKI